MKKIKKVEKNTIDLPGNPFDMEKTYNINEVGDKINEIIDHINNGR